jgi:hypothetical protein
LIGFGVIWRERRKVAMFENVYEYDYDRMVDDSEDLMDDDYYGSDDEYDYDLDNEKEFDCYYHNIADELIDD